MLLTSIQKNKFFISLKLGLIGFLLSILIVLFTGQNDIFLESSVVGFFIGFFNGLFETFFSSVQLRKFNFSIALLIRASVYAVIIIFSTSILTLIKFSVVKRCTVIEAINETGFSNYINENHLISLLFFLLLLSFLISLILQISQLLGPGVMLKYLLGKYHKPRLEKRFFLFLDLNSSTTIAEILGTEKYSSFLKEFFADMTEPLLLTKGRVFQYCGDEMVVVWNEETGSRNNNPLKFVFLAEEVINKLKEKYIAMFGIVPEFKAGLHYGETIVNEVGSLKREIVYHGDLINTASRIRSACKALNKKILASESMVNKLNNDSSFKTEDIGFVKLKGKKELTRLFAIQEA